MVNKILIIKVALSMRLFLYLTINELTLLLSLTLQIKKIIYLKYKR